MASPSGRRRLEDRGPSTGIPSVLRRSLILLTSPTDTDQGAETAVGCNVVLPHRGLLPGLAHRDELDIGPVAEPEGGHVSRAVGVDAAVVGGEAHRCECAGQRFEVDIGADSWQSAAPVTIQNGGSVSDQRSACRSSTPLW